MYHNWKYSFHIGMSPLSVSTGRLVESGVWCSERGGEGLAEALDSIESSTGVIRVRDSVRCQWGGDGEGLKGVVSGE